MMKRLPGGLAVLFVLLNLFVIADYALAADPQTADAQKKPKPEGRDAPLWESPGTQPATPPIIEKIDKDKLRIGNILIDKKMHTVMMQGTVNMRKGLVEYLACGKHGKLHESVLSLDVNPYNLQIALLLIGLEHGDKPLAAQGASENPKGDPIQIDVAWQTRQHKYIRYNAEKLVINVKTIKPMSVPHWIFTGSQIIDGRFMAAIEQSIIATYHDPFAIIDHPLHTGADDTVYYANTDILPEVGTPVSVTIRPSSRKNANN